MASFMDPAKTTLDTLGSITQLMKIYAPTAGGEESAEYQALRKTAEHETAFLTAGVIALNSSPLLQQRLGTGLAAGAQVAELLKRRQAETLYNKAIDTTLKIQSIQNKGFSRATKDLYGNGTLIDYKATK